VSIRQSSFRLFGLFVAASSPLLELPRASFAFFLSRILSSKREKGRLEGEEKIKEKKPIKPTEWSAEVSLSLINDVSLARCLEAAQGRASGSGNANADSDADAEAPFFSPSSPGE